MSSLNSQESSNDICKLTDKQQAEYRNAYQEYIAQMAGLEGAGSGVEKPVQPHPGQFMHSSDDKGKDGAEPDGRKAYPKRGGGKAPETPDYNNVTSAADAPPLDPITEEDEKPDHGSSKAAPGRRTSGERVGLFQGADLKLKGAGLRYQKLTSDDDESEESDNAPLLGDGKKPGPNAGDAARPLAKGKEYLSDAMLDKKDSSDSGVRSSESSPNHSLQDEEADLSQLERANLIELDEESLARKRGISLPHSLSGLQDPTVARMSICSEDQCSLLASSPEESWPSSKTFNLNRTPSNTTLNNNSNSQQANQRGPPGEGSTPGPEVIVAPSTGTTADSTAPAVDNVRVVHLKRSMNPGEAPEIHVVSTSDAVTFGEERESIL